MISRRQPEESTEDYVERVRNAVEATRLVVIAAGQTWQVKTSKTDSPAKVRVIAVAGPNVEWQSLRSKLKAKESQQTFRAAFEPSWEIEGEK